MQTNGAIAGQFGLFRGFTRYQWLIFFVAWAGWSLDATDFGLFSLVLRPALTELLGGQPSIADIGRVGGLLSTVGLLGWSIGGFLFGIVADYIGRVRTLALSILIYSVFTGLQGLAQSPFELGVFRFFAGVGTGAEIIVGIPLVAEAFAEVHRAKVLGVMMTGGAMGSIIGGQLYALIGGYGWRWVFFAGVAPALLLLLIRRGMVEPEHFRAVRERRQALSASRRTATDEDREFLRFVPVQLFSKQLRFNTLVGLLFALGTLLAIWTTVIWLPTIQSLMLEKEGIKGAAAVPIIGRNMMLWGIGGIFGYASFGFIADRIGRRPTVALYNIGTLVLGLTLFLGVDSYRALPVPAGGSTAFSSLACFPATPSTFPSCSRPMCGQRRCRSATAGPGHHQHRAAGRRPPGRAVRRQLQHPRRDHDLLCAVEHLRDVSRPRDPRRAAAPLIGRVYRADRAPTPISAPSRSGASSSSRLGPEKTARPRSRTIARSANSSASRACCSTRRIARPPPDLSRSKACSSASTMTGASPSNGSSISNRLGLPISARPIASICCSPPDSWLPRLRRREASGGNRS